MMSKKIVKIGWYDATGYMDKDKAKVLSNSVKHYLTKTYSIGYILKEDEYGIILVSSDNGEDIDMVALPKGWIFLREEYVPSNS